VVNHVREQLTGLLELGGARLGYGAPPGHPPRLEPDGTVMVGRSRWDVDLAGLSGLLVAADEPAHHREVFPDRRPGTITAAPLP
jgi:hypothetical protein